MIAAALNFCLLVLTLSWTTLAAGAAEPSPSDAPIQFESDLVTYDKERKVIEATGNVVARQTGRTLYADVLIYDELENRITARGNVRLIEPTGDVTEADTMELTGDFKDGVADNIRRIFADGSTVTGKTGERKAGLINTLNDATYTPCLPCAKHPDAAPLWQVQAVRVVHDEQEKVVEFDHAWVEIAGVPVAYTPYFSRPDPTVRRKSGFLMPTFGSQSDIGLLVRIPYYYVLSDNQDITVTPWITSAQYPVLQAEYRGVFTHAEVRADGSITQDVDGETGGHIFGTARYDINDNWRAGLDAQRALYRTYLRRYGFGGERTLVSRLFTENFSERNYFVGNAYAFQNLDENSKQETIPFVAPMLDYYYSGTEDALGGSSDFRLNGLALTRENGQDTRRMSARGGWQRPFVGPFGNLLTVSAAVWADGYQAEDLPLNSGRDFSGFQGRLFPTGSVSWSLPLVNDHGWIKQTIEPVAEFVAAPRYGNSNKIPDEDSLDFDLQTTNLFGLNPSPGLDRVLEGSRVNYGMNWRGYGIDDATASVFIGQAYQLFDDNPFGPNTGYHGGLSDVVSSVEISPKRWLSVNYRNRFSPEDLTLQTNEVNAWLGNEALSVATGYVSLEPQPSKNLVAREEIAGVLNARLSRYWRTQFTGVRDIKTESNRSLGLQLTYEDECLLFTAGFTRRNYEDQGLDPQNVFLVRLWLKTLGDISTGFKPGG
ncbi:MAG: LPS assembly protein LptD [Rhodospirillales bacterium]